MYNKISCEKPTTMSRHQEIMKLIDYYCSYLSNNQVKHSVPNYIIASILVKNNNGT